MATRTLEVNITGDPSRFNRSMGTVDTSVDHSTKKFDRMGKVGKAAFSGLALAAGAAAAVGLKQAATAAIEAEKTQARLEAQLKASSLSYKQHGDRIEEVIGKVSRLSGLDDEDLTDSFTNIVRVTGDVNKSLRLTGLAADFARAKHMDVAKAGELVGKVAGGNTGILGRYGIKIKEGATATEALGELQKKFAGQAKAYGDTTAGSVDKAGVAWENLMEVLGAKLAPVIQKAAGILSSLFDTQSKGNRVLRRLADAYMDWLKIVRDAVRGAARAVENWVEKNREQINDVIRAFKRVGNFIKDIVTTVIIPIIKRIAPIVIDFAETVIRQVGRMIRIVSSLINGDWDKAWDAFKDMILDVVKSVPRIMGRLLSAFNDGFRKMIGAIGKAGEKLGNKLIDGMVSGIKENGKGIAETLSSFIPTPDNIIKKGMGLGKSIVGGIGDSIKGAMPRGVPSMGGGSFNGDLHGSNPIMAGPAGIAAKFGLQITAGKDDHSKYTSSGNISNHYFGNAMDFSNGFAPTPQMMAFAKFMVANYGSQLAELIYTPLGFSIDNGQKTAPIAADAHYNHVHVALAGPLRGGARRGRTGDGRGRDPRTGDGPGTSALKIVAAAAHKAGILPQVLYGVWGAESNFSMGPGPSSPAGATGPFQFMPATARGMGVNPSNFTSAAYGAARYLAQYKGRGLAGMLAAYNAGPAGNPNNPETQAYIPRVRAFMARWPGVGGKSGGSPGAGGGGGGTADLSNPASGRAGPMGVNRAGGFGDTGGGKGQGPGRAKGGGGGGGDDVSSFDMALARVGVKTARAEKKDDLSGLIKAMVQERKIKRRRLKLIKRVLKGRVRNRARKQRLLQEQAQLISEIGDLTEGIKEFKADAAGGATTISRAEELDAGVDPNAADAAAEPAGPTEAEIQAQTFRDELQEEIRNLLKSIDQNQKNIERLATAQGPQMYAALLAAVNGDIGGKVGLGYSTPSYAGGGASY